MTFKAIKTAAYISAALFIAAQGFGRTGDVIKRADNGRSNVENARTLKSAANPKRSVFAKIGPLRSEPGSSGGQPADRDTAQWDSIVIENDYRVKQGKGTRWNK